MFVCSKLKSECALLNILLNILCVFIVFNFTVKKTCLHHVETTKDTSAVMFAVIWFSVMFVVSLFAVMFNVFVVVCCQGSPGPRGLKGDHGLTGPPV